MDPVATNRDDPVTRYDSSDTRWTAVPFHGPSKNQGEKATNQHKFGVHHFAEATLLWPLKPSAGYTPPFGFFKNSAVNPTVRFLQDIEYTLIRSILVSTLHIKVTFTYAPFRLKSCGMIQNGPHPF